MLTLEQVKEISRRLASENGVETDDSSGDISSIVYRIDPWGDPDMTNRHVDIEYSFGDYFEITEDSPLFEYIRELCDLPLINDGLTIVLWGE